MKGYQNHTSTSTLLRHAVIDFKKVLLNLKCGKVNIAASFLHANDSATLNDMWTKFARGGKSFKEGPNEGKNGHQESLISLYKLCFIHSHQFLRNGMWQKVIRNHPSQRKTDRNRTLCEEFPSLLSLLLRLREREILSFRFFLLENQGKRK